MTKAKTKSRRVWLVSHPTWETPLICFSMADAKFETRYREDCTYVAATLTWTPPTKAKKRRAK